MSHLAVAMNYEAIHLYKMIRAIYGLIFPCNVCRFGLLFLIMREPQNSTRLRFMTPWVPLLPVCAVFANIYLMLKLSPLTWVRFVVWMAIGNKLEQAPPHPNKQKGFDLECFEKNTVSQRYSYDSFIILLILKLLKRLLLRYSAKLNQILMI